MVYIFLLHVFSGSANQMVKVIKVKEKDSDCISTIRHHDGFMGQRIGPVNSMSFHPHRVSASSLNLLVNMSCMEYVFCKSYVRRGLKISVIPSAYMRMCRYVTLGI
jgi:hypothetical protein